MLHVLGYIGTLLAGAFAGVLLDHHLKPKLQLRRQRRVLREISQERKRRDLGGKRMILRGVDFGLHVLAGNLGGAYEEHEVQAHLTDREWSVPAEVRQPAVAIANQRGWYDGRVARLAGLRVATYPDQWGTERHRLDLDLIDVSYFDHLASDIASHARTEEERARRVTRDDLVDSPLSNVLSLDLTLVTVDGYVPIFRRSTGMVGADGCWQTSSGETLQLPADLDPQGRPSVFRTARRGLEEELGIPSAMLSNVALTAIVSVPGYAGIGVLMRAQLNMTADEFDTNLEQHILAARDNWEYSDFDMLALHDVEDIAQKLTADGRAWTRQATASLIFAFADRGGDVGQLAETIRRHGPMVFGDESVPWLST